MNNKARYTNVRATSFLDLEAKVEDLLNKGYIPTGGVVIVPTIGSITSKYYYQAMYKLKKET